MILAIYGTGGTGREVFELISESVELSSRWESIIFVDDFNCDRELYGAPVLSFSELADRFDTASVEFVIAVGEPTARESLFAKVDSSGFGFATVVHPNSFVAPSASLGRGVVVKMQSIVSSEAVVDDNVFLQANVIVGHDVHIGAHSQISAFSHIAGGAHLGARCYLGVRASVREECEMGDDALLAMGAVVMEKRVPARVLAAGNPAKYVRRKAGSKVFS